MMKIISSRMEITFIKTLFHVIMSDHIARGKGVDWALLKLKTGAGFIVRFLWARIRQQIKKNHWS